MYEEEEGCEGETQSEVCQGGGDVAQDKEQKRAGEGDGWAGRGEDPKLEGPRGAGKGGSRAAVRSTTPHHGGRMPTNTVPALGKKQIG